MQVQGEEVKSLRVQGGGQGCGEGWVEGTVKVRWEAGRLLPPAASPAGSGAECWPAAPSGEGWVRHGSGSSAACPGTGPAPAASAGDTGGPAQAPRVRSVYASPHGPARTYTETEQSCEREKMSTSLCPRFKPT